ncbi:hypothetical protein [Paraburkholderia sp. MM5496-R1]|uniref:hypothetical protein n=1 Tax=Paraburkholderia sp. MM5496-R1 TaxID=2991065 RepID=UPI003D21ADA4
MKFVDGTARQFWTALLALIAIRLLFALIDTLGSVLSWRLYGKKAVTDMLLRFLRDNRFPKREYSHDDSLAYFGRIEDGEQYSEPVKSLAKEMTLVMTVFEHQGILLGMRTYAAADAALDVYSPRADAPVWGTTDEASAVRAHDAERAMGSPDAPPK